MSECNSVESTYYQRNRDVILNRAQDYYENDKERLIQQARDKNRNLSEEDKNKIREYGKIDAIICLKKKDKLKEYQKLIVRLKRLNVLMNKIVF